MCPQQSRAAAAGGLYSLWPQPPAPSTPRTLALGCLNVVTGSPSSLGAIPAQDPLSLARSVLCVCPPAPSSPAPRSWHTCTNKPLFSVLQTSGFGGQVWIRWALAHVFIQSKGLGFGISGAGGSPEPGSGPPGGVCLWGHGSFPPGVRSSPSPCDAPPTLSISAWSQGPGDQFLTCLLVSWPHFHTLTSKCHIHCVLFGTAIYPHPYAPSPPSPSSASPPSSPETCPALAPWAVHDAHGLLCQAVGPRSSLPAASTQSCASEHVFGDFQNHVLFAALEILMSTWSVLNPHSNVRSCPLSEGQGAGEESPKVRLGFFGLLLGHCCEREKG